MVRKLSSHFGEYFLKWQQKSNRLVNFNFVKFCFRVHMRNIIILLYCNTLPTQAHPNYARGWQYLGYFVVEKLREFAFGEQVRRVLFMSMLCNRNLTSNILCHTLSPNNDFMTALICNNYRACFLNILNIIKRMFPKL